MDKSFLFAGYAKLHFIVLLTSRKRNQTGSLENNWFVGAVT